MISMHAVGSTGQAMQYFEKDNYYTKTEGYALSAWTGKGAEALQLSGNITRDDFKNVLNGKIEGQKLGRLAKDEAGNTIQRHRVGWDFTFAAPKSVSLVAEVAGDRQVRMAHEAAVDAALSYLERETAQARVTENGVTRFEKTGNFIVAKFYHTTSRELDPQTHTHAVIANATRCRDGQWRSLSNEAMFKHRMTADSLYVSHLASSLTRLGYELERQPNGRFEIQGFTRAQLEHFSQRSAQIAGALAAKGLDRASASAQQRELATLDTRQAKKEVSHEAIHREWQLRAGGVGMVLEPMVAQARERGRHDPISIEQIIREGRDAVRFAVAHLTQRQSVVEKQSILREAAMVSMGKTTPEGILRAYAEMERHGALIATRDGRVTTPEAIRAEQQMIGLIARGKQAVGRLTGSRFGDVQLPSFVIAPGRFGDLQLPGSRLHPEQQTAALTILWSTDRFVGVQGYAGTGKTTMLNVVRETAAQEGWMVRGMAVSASAAQVLQHETGIRSTTVKSFTDTVTTLGSNPATSKELWIVDEASLLSQREANAIMRAAEVRGAKVAFIGDTRQLSGVDAGKPFDLAQRHGMVTATMTQIYRQKTNRLKEAVSALIAGRQQAALAKLTTVEMHDARALIDRIVHDITAKTPAERHSFLIVTATNRDRQAINDGVRASLKAKGEIVGEAAQGDILVSKGWTTAQTQRAQWYREGDVVRFGREYTSLGVAKGEYARVASTNERTGTVYLTTDSGRTVALQPARQGKVEVYDAERRELQAGDTIRFTRNSQDFINGQTARVEQIAGEHARVRLTNGQQTTLNLAQDKHWDYGYASTIHASQGRTVDYSAVHITRGSQQAFGERSFYVAATRARQDTTIYTNDREAAAQLVTRPQEKSSALEAIGDLRQRQDDTSEQRDRPNGERESRAHDKAQERQASRERGYSR